MTHRTEIAPGTLAADHNFVAQKYANHQSSSKPMVLSVSSAYLHNEFPGVMAFKSLLTAAI